MRTAIASAALLIAAAGAQAATITYTYSGTSGFGQGDWEWLDEYDFVLTAVADTEDVTPVGEGYYVVHTSVTLTLVGLGTFDIITPMATWRDANGNLGFGNADGSLCLNGPYVLLDDWDMTTDVGPVSGDTGYWWEPMQTENDGAFFFWQFTDEKPVTFSAALSGVPVAPVPAAAPVAGLGLGLLAARRRR